jgi:hypothetical protein
VYKILESSFFCGEDKLLIAKNWLQGYFLKNLLYFLKTTFPGIARDRQEHYNTILKKGKG